jgi:flagellar basal body-associated protein FliL
MYPEDSTKARKKPLIILAIIIVVMVIVAITLTAASSSSGGGSGPKGTLELNYNMSDTIGVTVKLNGKTQKTTNKYSLTPGKYTLKIDRPGYETFTTSVDVKENSSVLVSVRAELVESPPVDTSEDLAPLLPADYITAKEVTSTEYFYDKTWAVVHFNSDEEDNDVAVLRYVPETGKWIMIGTPGLALDENEVGDAPAAVLSYLNDNDLIFSGD